MKLGVRLWNLEFELSKNTFQARIPLRIKLTFYIGVVTVIGMTLLAAVCIVKSLSYTQWIMKERLSQFAAMNAQQIERVVTNQATTLRDAMQGSTLTKSFESLYYGNVTTEEWASSMDSLVKYLFSTSLLEYQAVYLYDNSESLLFSMANPVLPDVTIKELNPALPYLLPLGSMVEGSETNQTQVPNNQSAVLNASAADAAAASWVALQKNHTSGLNETEVAYLYGNDNTDEESHKNGKRKLNFTNSAEGVPSWLSQPQPLADKSGNITAYSYSLTIPVLELKVIDNVQTSQLIGYCSAIIDCSQYLYEGTNIVFNSSMLAKEMRDPWFTIVETDQYHGWRYLFPTGFNYTRNSQWHAMSEFPAVAADLVLRKRFQNSTLKVGGALTKTNTPRVSKASVGYSFATLLNQKWLILLSLPQSQVEAGYRKLFEMLAGVAAAILVFVLLCAFFVAGLITRPLFHIYHGMELRPRPPGHMKISSDLTAVSMKGGENVPANSESGTAGKTRYQETQYDSEDNMMIPGLFRTLHANLSSRTLVSLFSLNHSDHEQGLADVTDDYGGVGSSTGETPNKIEGIANNVEEEQSTVLGSASEVTSIPNDGGGESEDGASEFHVPAPVQPLNRWISDEFDELIWEYNMLVDRLNAQYTKMEDEVRLRTHEARESQRSAEAANAAKSKFMMNISHELLTPMNGIMGFTATTAEETDLEAVYSGLRKIIKSGNVLQELLKELLNYAAHLAGIEETFQSFSLYDLAAVIRNAFAETAEVCGIAFEVETHHLVVNEEGVNQIENTGNWFVETDFDRVQQICMSLVSNAIKFSDPTKTASVRPSVGVHISLTQPDRHIDLPVHWDAEDIGMLEVIVYDTGVGISKNRLAHVFEVFVQGDDVLSKRFTGTGLGLAMSKLLCERLGGYIKVYTRPNFGTTVILRIPVNNINQVSLLEQFPSYAATTPVFTEALGSGTVWRTDSLSVGEISGVCFHNRHSSTVLPTVTAPTEPRRALVSKVHHQHNLEPIVESPTSSRHKKSQLGSLSGVNGGSSQLSSLSSSPPSSSSPGPGSGSPNSRSPNTSSLNSMSPISGGEDSYLHSMRVLVAEDNDVLRSLIERYLEKLGIGQVDTAASGEEVIERVEDAIVEGTRYSIIFMDLSMPNTDGIEATSNIQRQLGYVCPVVALTGHSDAKTVERCMQAGLQKVLVKPVSQAQLSQTITELVSASVFNHT